jgi:type IV secretion system protein TrbL
VVLVPMLLFAAIRAVIAQDLTQLLRSFFLYLPMAILGTFLAMSVTGALLSVTDALSASVANGIAGDTRSIFDAVGDTLSGSVGRVDPTIPSFAIFFGALLLIVGSFLVWLELLIRSAAVTVSVFFLPLMLAGLVWPATARWTRRLIETLVALILSKFVIVAVISLATAAMADPGGGGFGTVMGGAALMLMAALSPFALLKLMPAMEGAAMTHLDRMRPRPFDAARPGSVSNQALWIMRSKVNPTRQAAVAGAGAAVAGTVGVAASQARGRTSAASTSSIESRGRADAPAKGAVPKPSGGSIDHSARPRRSAKTDD